MVDSAPSLFKKSFTNMVNGALSAQSNIKGFLLFVLVGGHLESYLLSDKQLQLLASNTF